MPASPMRINVTLEPRHAETLRRLAEQAFVQEGALARSLLSRAIEEADVDTASMAALLDGITGASERAIVGRDQGRRGETVPLDEL